MISFAQVWPSLRFPDVIGRSAWVLRKRQPCHPRGKFRAQVGSVSAVTFMHSTSEDFSEYLGVWLRRVLRGFSEDTDVIYQETSQIPISGQEFFFSLSFFWKDISYYYPEVYPKITELAKCPTRWPIYIYIQEEEEELKIKKRETRK